MFEKFAASAAWGFAKRHWKGLAIGAAVIAGVIGFNIWKNNIEQAAYDHGFGVAEKQYADAVDEANKRSAEDNKMLDQMVAAFGNLSAANQREVIIKTQPFIERIQSEIANDPRYRDCAVSDSVLDDRQAGRAAVNASVAAGNTGKH